MKSKYWVNKNSISIIGGICFILFALVTILSPNTPFAFLMNIITHSFGFIGFWLLLPFIFVLGVYLIIKKRFVKIKLETKFLGFFLIIICFLILSSHWGSVDAEVNGVIITGSGRTETGVAKYLTFSNAISVFDDISANYPSVVGPHPRLGGGKVGYIVAGALNSALTPVGLNLICWILFIGALLIIFNKQVSKLLSLIKTRKSRERETEFKEVSLTMDEIEPEEQPIVKPVVKQVVPPVVEEPAPVEETKPQFDNKPLYESFHASPLINNEYGIKKARFSINEEKNQYVEPASEFQRANFEEPKPTFENERSSFSEIAQDKVEIIEDNSETVADIKEVIPQEYAQEEVIEKPQEPEVDFLHKPQPKAKLEKNYIFPSIDLLDKASGDDDSSVNEASCQERTEIINKTLSNLHVGAKVVSYTVGPSVTRFDIQTDDGVSVDSVQKAVNTIAVKLGGLMVRFEPIVAGKSTSGLEIPNEIRTNVTLRESVEGLPQGAKHNLDIPFGKSISGELKFANLADFPHLLVAGTTGSGKSIFVHATIVSLLMRNKPEELKLIMVDPKKVEMSYYEDIPHLLCPVISDLRKVYVCFSKLVDEMERRYTLFSTNRVRDIKGFNEFAKSKGLQPLPYIIVFIDEYADLIETCKNIRESVVRIVQKARAAGIHMVFATQRPSVNVIDGVIKANVATRVALMCASATDSMTVIGSGGAESLLGNGDMLIDCPLLSRSIKPRVQGCYVSETEIMRVCEFLREHYQPQFDPVFMNLDPVPEEKFEEVEVAPIDKSKGEEEVYQRIKDDAKHREYFSISYITRTYQMGFSRAGKIFTRLQKEGVVATTGDARGCKVLIYSPYDSQVSSEEVSTLIPDDGTSSE